MYSHNAHTESVVIAVNELARSLNSGRKVVADMSLLIKATSQLKLSKLEYWERLIRWEFNSVMRKSSPPKWKVWSKPTNLLTWIDLISWDGFRRERTLRTLNGGFPNGFFCALALRRLNDWVPQVRKAAREKMLVIARDSRPDYIADALCATLPYVNSWGRFEEEDQQVLFDIISLNKVAQLLKTKIISAASGPMNSVFVQVGRTSVLDAQLCEIAKNAVQPSVRAKAYRSLLEGKMTWLVGRKWEWTNLAYCKGHSTPVLSERNIDFNAPFMQTLRMAASDRSSIVRRVAAEMLIRELRTVGDESVELANMFVSDSSCSVSERGKFVLRQLELGRNGKCT